jgi:rhodanese-related sulfurtransferase
MPHGHAIAAHLELVRSGLDRLTPSQPMDRVRRGGYLVDTRPEFQRRADGEVPFGIVVERNHLEWRLDPSSDARIPEAVDHHLHWIILCDERFSSSLAAASLRRLGLRHATDVIGGFQCWRSDGLPVIRPATTTRPRLWPDTGHPRPHPPQGVN